MRKRLKKKLAQRNKAMTFMINRKGKTYPVMTFLRGVDNFMVNIKEMNKWVKVFENNNSYMVIQQTEVSHEIRISTVFLGINHNFRGTTPILFETMIFGGEYDRHMWRYTNIKKARAGHRRALALVMESK